MTFDLRLMTCGFGRGFFVHTIRYLTFYQNYGSSLQKRIMKDRKETSRVIFRPLTQLELLIAV